MYVDMDDVLCNYSEAFNKAIDKQPDIAYPQSQYGFFADLAPIDGAIEGITTLHKSEQYDVYILTAPSEYNPMCYTEKRKWVEEYLGMEFVKRLIISPHKHLNKGHFLIDDHTEGRGQDKFEGELIHFGSDAWPNWKSITNKLIHSKRNGQNENSL